VGFRLSPSLAQGVCLRFSSSFGHGFREVREKNREPQPKCDLQAETDLACVMKGIPH